MNIKKTIKDYRRKRLLRLLTCNYGDVIEDDDKIVCRINYIPVGCKVINITTSDLTQLFLKKNGLDKQVCFYFDNINLNNINLSIFSNNCKTLFNNCNIRGDITINIGGECIFDNCNIECPNRLFIYCKEFVSRDTYYSIFKNINSLNTGIEVKINSINNIEFLNSHFSSKSFNDINCSLMANGKIDFCDSSISNANNVYMLCNDISSNDNSVIETNNLDIVTNDDCEVFHHSEYVGINSKKEINMGLILKKEKVWGII